VSDQFVHLHVHTEYSMLDGAAKVGPLLSEAARLGMPAVGMTDHGNMYGAEEFYRQARKNDVKPIIGIEAYVAPNSRFHKKPVFWGEARQRSTDAFGEGGDVSGAGSYTHMTMLAKNATGLRNLFKISSLASIEGYYRKPRSDRELISDHAEGIIATTGCPSGEVQTRLRLGQPAEALRAAADYRDIFGPENFFLELMDHGLAIERSVRDGLLDIGRQLGLRPLATNDSHYVTADQADAHSALLCVQSGKTLSDPTRFKFDGNGYYLKPASDMRSYWDTEVPGATDSTLLVAEMVEDYTGVFDSRNLMPKFPVPAGETEETWLRKEVFRGLADRFPQGVPEGHIKQADYELGVILQMGFPGYFLVTADLVGYAKRNGIRVGPGRGSAAGALIAYALGITDLDPIEHKLIFERFLNPERVSMPDIDLDFDERRRGEMIRYTTERYGEDRVAQIITYGTIKAKAAIKDASRILGFPFSVGDRITKAMPPAVMGKDIPLSGITDESHPRYSEAQEIRTLYETDPDVRKVIDTALGLEGLIRQAGVHAAGVIMSSEPLMDIVPVWRRDNDGAIITQFDYPTCESMGLLKMDFLGLRNLTIMDDAVVNIKTNHGFDLDLLKLPLTDEETYKLLARGDTLGVFQLDGGPMRSLLRSMVPTAFDDISAVLALYRPGPMAANAHNDYADRKNGRKPVVPIHKELEEPLAEILGETYGLIVYQEQVMAIAQKVAGYSLGQADLLRRAMGKKKRAILDKEFVGFEAGMRERSYSEEAIKTLWDILVPFSDYAFNRAHTAGYGLVSYWTAYLKANYPAEYMAALLTSVRDDKDKMAIYLTECRRMGIQVLPPDVNESGLGFTPVGKDIRFGMGAVRNVGANVVASVVESRRTKGRYVSFTDFLEKSEIIVCNKRVIDSLIKAGAFDSLNHSRLGLQVAHESAVDAVISFKRKEAEGQFDLFGMDDDPLDTMSTSPLADLAFGPDEWPRKQLLAHERDMLGLYVSSHPLQGAERILARHADNTIAEIIMASPTDESGRGRSVRIAGMIASVNRRINKNGEPWAVVTLEDLDAGVEVLFFPKSYPQVAELLVEDSAITVTGRLNDRDGSVSVFASSAESIDISMAGTGLDENPPIVLSVEASRITSDLVGDLRRALETNPGNTPVRLMMNSRRGATLFALPGYLVNPNPAFFGEVKELLGAGAIISEGAR
jgi:DNA polymerase-3 subunit alpha